jgi:hypothetical protein
MTCAVGFGEEAIKIPPRIIVALRARSNYGRIMLRAFSLSCLFSVPDGK